MADPTPPPKSTGGGSPPPPSPIGGIALSAFLDVAAGIVLANIGVPLGLDGPTRLIGALALIAGSVAGWAMRARLSAFRLGRAALLSLFAAFVFLVACLALAHFEMGFIPGIAYIGCAGLLCLAVGVLCAIAGVRLAEPKGGSDD
jgi:hypothetical protein